MTSQFNSIPTKSLHVPVYENPGKTLSTDPKSLGSAVEGGGNDLANWVENNRYIYDAIMAGTSDLPPAEQNQFMQWWSWAMSQVGSSAGWDPTAGNLLNNSSVPAQDNSCVLPEGAEPGPNGNAVFRRGTATTTYVPTSMPVDVLSDEFTLNVDVKVQDIVVEKATDTRLNPPTDCIKITVKDPFSTPAETVYYVHELDAKININTVSGAEDVTINGDLPNVTVGKYSAESADGSNAQSSIPGEPVVDGDGNTVENAFYYEVAMPSDVIDFRAQASGAGTNEDHYVYGSSNISIPVSSSADVQKAGAPFLGADGKNYDFKVVVTHKDGSTDTFFLKDEPEFTHNINALSENVKFDGVEAEEGKIPEGFEDLLSLNGGVTGSGVNPDYPEDTQPADGVEGQYGDNVALVYDSPTVDIHPTPGEGAIEIHANEVNLTMTSMMDEVTSISVIGDYYEITIDFRDGTSRKIRIDKDAKINIDGKVSEDVINSSAVDLSNITFNGEIADATGGEYPVLIDNLARETDKSPETIASEIFNHFGYIASQYDKDEDGALSPAELNEAIEAGAFPPSEPTQDLLEFVSAIDDEFKRHLNNADQWEQNDLFTNLNQASTRLVDVLKTIYPDMASQISFTQPSSSTYWRNSNIITFGSMTFKYSYSGESQSTTNQVNFSTNPTRQDETPEPNFGFGGGLDNDPTTPW